MLRGLLFFLSCFLTLQLTAQISAKYYGKYEGVIPTYKLDLGTDVVTVAETSIRITLSEKSFEQTIGNETKTGTWELYFQGKTYYIINVTLNDQKVKERIVIYKKGDKMTREGLFPQPSAELRKK